MTAYNLSAEQRCLLAECLRAGLTGWLVTCPTAGRQCRQFQARATLGALFSFSRFATLVRYRFGADYRPRCPGTDRAFPLSVEEAIVIANDLELGFATDDEVYAAAAVAAHSPYAQPEVGSRDWKLYLGVLAAAGLDTWAGDPRWRSTVHDRMDAFRRAAASRATAAE